MHRQEDATPLPSAPLHVQMETCPGDRRNGQKDRLGAENPPGLWLEEWVGLGGLWQAM